MDKQPEVVYDKIGMADFQHCSFRLRVTLETVTPEMEVINDLTSIALNVEPLSYVELLNLVPALWAGLYNKHDDLREEGEEYADLALHAGLAFETLQEAADQLQIDYDEEGNIVNRL